MRRLLSLAATGALLVAGLAAGARGDVKLLTGFEPADAQRWGAKADGDIYQWAPDRPGWVTSRQGDATEGQWALAAERGAYIKSGTAHYDVLRRQAVLNTYGRFEKLFPTDWSGYDRLRLDVKSAAAAGRLRVELEDEICQPLVRRTYAIPAGRWVTVEFDLAAASKVHEIPLPPGEAKRLGFPTLRGRRLNPARMANICIYFEQMDGPSTVLLDNVRLLTADAVEKGERKVLRDESPLLVPRALPDVPPRPPHLPQGFEPSTTPLGEQRAAELDISQFRGTSYDRVGGVTARAFTAADAEHMLLGVLAGYVYVVQTADGGRTWHGLDGGATPTCAYHNANAPSHCAAAAGGDMLYVYTDHCAGGASPSNMFFRCLTFDGSGWKLGPPRLVDVDCRHCPEFRVRVLRLASGRIWAAWMHLDRHGKTAVRARYSDDEGLTWRDPDSNAMLVFDRDDSQGPQQYGVTLWTEANDAGLRGTAVSDTFSRPGEEVSDTFSDAVPQSPAPPMPPVERANGRVGEMFGQGQLELVPCRGHVAAIYNRSWQPYVYWSAFDGARWGEPLRVGAAQAMVRGAADFGGTIYVALAGRKGEGQLLRLDGDKWTDATPPDGRAGVLTVAGDQLYCFRVAADGERFVLSAVHRTADGPWSEPRQIAVETIPGPRASLGVTAPIEATGPFIPLAWGPHDAWVKFLRYPVAR